MTEIYYPRIDIPQIKDLGFIIADDDGFWVELRRLGNYSVSLAGPGVPAVKIVHRHPRFTFILEICPSQRRDVLLLRYRLEHHEKLRVYALLAARLGGDAESNEAWVATHNGRQILWAEQGPFGLALAAANADGADAWQRCSVGCLEASDGWQDFNQNGRMTWLYDSAGPGAVSLMGELPQQARLALGLATSKEAAATLSLSSLMDEFSAEWNAQCRDWQTWLSKQQLPSLSGGLDQMLALSATVLKVHEDRTYRGATVASLSVPWGDASQSRGGYHLVWPRDLVETAGAFVAMESYHSARDALRYLIATQHEDGHWLQNQWLGGKPFWRGMQLDEVAFPVLLVSLLNERDALHGIPVKAMVARALRFIAREGPTTSQDRWEEDAGINTFTLAVAIAALVEGSDLLDGEEKILALRLADHWNAKIEDWAFVADTPIAKALGLRGHYIRTVPEDALDRPSARSEHVLIKNLAHDPDLPATAQISTDFLQLVRYGLRTADDPSIVDSIKAVDHLLKIVTPSGAVWHRYNDDGYGEHADGSAFDGTGHGRGWPLLTGERGHYALAAGEDVQPYLDAMMAMSSPLGLIPEQIWDDDPIAEHNLTSGRPSGSAMPLVWAHSEFIKLCCSLSLRHPVDRPSATWRRYGGQRPVAEYGYWGPNAHPSTLTVGKTLVIALKDPARVHWGINGWKSPTDIDTREILGLHIAELPTTTFSAGTTIQLTFLWRERRVWEGKDYEVLISE